MGSAAVPVRDMHSTDIDGLADWMVTVPLWRRYGLTERKAAASFQRALSRGDLLLVADSGGGSADGFVWVMPEGAFGRSPYLRLIGVRPGLTGRGLGEVLLRHAEDYAWGLSATFFLLVSDFNTDAQRFYERHGYALIGAIPDYVIAGVAELLYWKRRDTPR
jgi:ribosomal protein S18 acetylase RimI-like enzyme